MAKGDKREEDIINSIMKSSNVSKSQAIAIAKDQGLLKQKGKNLVTTKEGAKDDKRDPEARKKKRRKKNKLKKIDEARRNA